MSKNEGKKAVFKLKKIKLHTKIFIGLILGVVVGLVFGEKATIIEPVGTIFLRLITMIVVPLVLVSLMLGTASLGDIRKLGRIGIKTVGYFMITTMVAITIGLVLANVVKPGTGLDEEVRAELYKSYESKAQVSIQRMTERSGAILFSTGELKDAEGSSGDCATETIRLRILCEKSFHLKRRECWRSIILLILRLTP